LCEVQFIFLNVTVHKRGGGIVYLHGLGSQPHQHWSSSQGSEVKTISVNGLIATDLFYCLWHHTEVIKLFV
jgi:hypothetical protein